MKVQGVQRKEQALPQASAPAAPVSKMTALRGLSFDEAVQRLAPGGAQQDPASVHAAAQRGVAGSGGALPHLDAIQRSFGAHDVSGVGAHVGGAAAEACGAMGAEAYATGRSVAFKGAPDLHTAAHEAAHVVQQRQGVSLKGGVGASGDAYERHADAVADRVVAGKSAEDLLGAPANRQAGEGVQRKDARAENKARLHALWLQLKDRVTPFDQVIARMDASLGALDGEIARARKGATKVRLSAAGKSTLIQWVGHVNTIRGIMQGKDVHEKALATAVALPRTVGGIALGGASLEAQTAFSFLTMMTTTPDPLDIVVALANVSVGLDVDQLKSAESAIELSVEALHKARLQVSTGRRRFENARQQVVDAMVAVNKAYNSF
jgi:hypothetical protein